MARKDDDELHVHHDSLLEDVDNIGSPITLNSATSTKIVDEIGADFKRREVVISNPSPLDVWIKEQAASIDNDIKGILLGGRSVLTLYSEGPIYEGEISAIASAGNPTVSVVEK